MVRQFLVAGDDPQFVADTGAVLRFLGYEAVEPDADPDGLSGAFVDARDGNHVRRLGQIPSRLGAVLVGDPGAVAAGNTLALEWPLRQAATLEAINQLLQGEGGRGERGRFANLVGASDTMLNVRRLMERVADTDVTVLITGESGTGKEVVARALHAVSDRRNGPFIAVNCGAIPTELLESELFGHEKGAFTGALSTRIGKFQAADGGTLFLDEVGDLPLHMQVKLLRVISERAVERVGGARPIDVDVRILAATHRDLEAMLAVGEFRDDLYYRLNVFPIEMPALRLRRDDIPMLMNTLVNRLVDQGYREVHFAPEAVMSLLAHPWSGNIRELANFIERMAIMHPGGVVGIEDLPARFRHDGEAPAAPALPVEADGEADAVSVLDPSATPLLPVNGIDLKDYIGRLERSLIEQALDDTGSVVARAADRLHVRRTTLVEKMRKYGIDRRDVTTH